MLDFRSAASDPSSTGRFSPTLTSRESDLPRLRYGVGYGICLILAVAAILLFKHGDQFDPGVLKLLMASIGVTIASELTFTLYVDVYGFSNLIGHYLKVISFYLVYRAIIQTGLNKPYNLVFRAAQERAGSLGAQRRTPSGGGGKLQTTLSYLLTASAAWFTGTKQPRTSLAIRPRKLWANLSPS